MGRLRYPAPVVRTAGGRRSAGPRALFVAWMLVLSIDGCRESADDAAPQSGDSEGVDLGSCEGLFGRPGPATGLDASRCSTECSCENGSWRASDHDEAAIEALEARVLLDPPTTRQSDPYETPEAYPGQPDEVCAVVPDDDDPRAYRLRSEPDPASVAAHGGVITHHGACGACSSLQDLAVYIRNDDLTAPVRDCGILGLSEGEDANVQCLLDLGFTPPCASIWYYNTAHTRSVCFSECFSALDDPYNLEDGSLNPCLQCDEDRSGPVFKAVAGRTRRNSGLPSAICRPCSTVVPLDHVYP
jgi:hypothetical protein